MGDNGEYQGPEAEKRHDLEMNQIYVDKAKIAKEHGDIEDAKEYFSYSRDICRKWGIIDGINWAEQNLREFGNLPLGLKKTSGESLPYHPIPDQSLPVSGDPVKLEREAQSLMDRARNKLKKRSITEVKPLLEKALAISHALKLNKKTSQIEEMLKEIETHEN